MKQLVGLFCFIIFCSPIFGQREYAPYYNPTPTQYIVGGSAFQLKEGEFQYKNTMLLVNSLTYGLTDHLSLGAGTELYTTISGESTDRMPNIYFVNAKAGFPLARNLQLSAGCEIALLRAQLFEDDSNNRIPAISLVYGLLTYGSATNNLTLGAYLPAVNWVNDVYNPAYTLGGTFRIGRAASIVVEAWIPFDRMRVFDGGFRFYGRKFAIDMGLIYVVGYIIPAPILSYTLKF